MLKRFARCRFPSLAMLLVAASLCLAAPQQPAPRAKPKVETPDPAVIDLPAYRAILREYQGKPLMINFWATWCEPCREEYPMVNELARKYAPQGLQVVGISLDEDGEITLVRRFLEKHKPVFPNYRKKPGQDEAFIDNVNQKWNGAIPATFFYTPDGRELMHLVGENPRDVFEKAIQNLLEASAKSLPAAGTKAGATPH